MIQLNGRAVVDMSVTGVDTRDYPDFVDAYFQYAVFEDTGEELSDQELETLTDLYPELVNSLAFESLL